MKKLIFLICMAMLLVGCGNKGGSGSTDVAPEKEEPAVAVEEEVVEDGKKMVTTTTSFLYDMVSQLAGDLVERELIIPAGEDPHLYMAKPSDHDKISKADLVLFHGLHFEGKMVEILEKTGTAVSKDFPQDRLTTMDEDGEIVVDPHFWFDLDLYKLATEAASESLQELLPNDVEVIKNNTVAYLAELDKLDLENKEKLEGIPEGSRYLVTPHDAFNYFSMRYDFEVVAPQGVSTDSEVATKDIQDTIDFIVEHKIKAVFAESTTDPARMEKLKEGCKAKGFDIKVVSGEGNELFSDSLAPEGDFGDNFIDMYKHNVDLIVNNLVD